MIENGMFLVCKKKERGVFIEVGEEVQIVGHFISSIIDGKDILVNTKHEYYKRQFVNLKNFIIKGEN